MKKLAIFTRVPTAYAPPRLKEEAERYGVRTEIINYSEINLEITQRGVKEFLLHFDFAIFRSSGKEFLPQKMILVSFLEKQGVKILNLDSYKKWWQLDKLTQQFVFQENCLPFVETMIFGTKKSLEKNIKDFPKVVKSYSGSHGENVFKVENSKDLKKIVKKYPPETLLVQPFLPAGEDIRVIVLGGKAIGAIKRIAQPGQFLTNYSAGGMVEKFELDKATRQLAEKAAKAFFLDYVGVDLMKDQQGQWRILEVNRACQFEGFEKSTGINVAKKIVNFLIKK